MEGWVSIQKDEYASVGLGPCALVVIRAQGDHQPFIGHFHQPDVLPRKFIEMLIAAQDQFANARGVRVDLFGCSTEVERMIEGDENDTKETRAFIERAVSEHGFTRVFTHWTKAGNAQIVQVDGGDKSVYVKEFDTEIASYR